MRKKTGAKNFLRLSLFKIDLNENTQRAIVPCVRRFFLAYFLLRCEVGIFTWETMVYEQTVSIVKTFNISNYLQKYKKYFLVLQVLLDCLKIGCFINVG